MVDTQGRTSFTPQAAARAIGRQGVECLFGRVHKTFRAVVKAFAPRCERGHATRTKLAKGHRFDLRLFRPFPADLSIKKSSIFFPPLIASTSLLNLAPSFWSRGENSFSETKGPPAGGWHPPPSCD